MRELRQEFFTLSKTGEDSKKTKMYLEEVSRKEKASEYTNIEDYLRSLSLRVSVIWNENISISRVSQMTQKTNQFNLTTRRYTEADISRMLGNEDWELATFSVVDAYGDYGITGLSIIAVDNCNRSEATIDTFLMSCRVIGRNIEASFFDEIVKILLRRGISVLRAEYVATNKNIQVEHFYDNLGFSLVSSNEKTKSYSINLHEYRPRALEYIEII